MTLRSALPTTCLLALACLTVAVSAHQYQWDSHCECWVPDTSGPTLPDDTADPNVPPDTEPSKFVLTGTGINADGNRALSDEITFNHHQPDGVVETRTFRYSTPRNFASRADSSVNLWLVFHGKNGSTTTMHNDKSFNRIPHDAPTVLVYPQALRVTYLNQVTSDPDEIIMWRSPKVPGSGDDVNAFRDVTFIDRLVTRLLVNNPQINANKVYVSGFSSGGTMTWMLLCYRSSLFAGFGVYSRQLGYVLEREGCGDGQLPGTGDTRTGYERLTGNAPDTYGRFGSIFDPLWGAPTRPVIYMHGTADDNLQHPGEPGCWAGRPPENDGECQLDEDPLYSMDYGGEMQDRDDMSSVGWLRARHQLSSTPVSDCTVLDADASNSDHVVTHRFEYAAPPPILMGLAPSIGARVTWYEMRGGGHMVSTLDQPAGAANSTDFYASLHTKSFFEDRAGMLKGPSSGSVLTFQCMTSYIP
jgi:poly(3-hydroxybutyrate) depolymerase